MVASRPTRHEPETVLQRPAYRVEPHHLEDRTYWEEDDVRDVRVRAENSDFPTRDGIDLDGDGIADLAYESSLPAYMI